MFRSGERYKTRAATKKLEKTVAGLKGVFKELDKLMNEDDPKTKEILMKELERRLAEEDDEYLKKKLAGMLISHLGGTELVEEKESQTEKEEEKVKRIEVVTLDDTPPVKEKKKTIEVITLDESTSIETAVPRWSTPFKHPIHRSPNKTITLASPSLNDSRRLTRSSQDLAKFLLQANSRPTFNTLEIERVKQEEPVKRSPWWKERRSIPMEMSSPQSPWSAAK